MGVMKGSAQGLAVLATIGAVACSRPNGGQTVASFGKLGDTPVQLYTLTNKNGLVAKITNYGAIVTELHVPDKDGRFADVVLGSEEFDGYAGPYVPDTSVHPIWNPEVFGDVVVVSGSPGRDPIDKRVRLITLQRPKDGFVWGKRPGEVVD